MLVHNLVVKRKTCIASKQANAHVNARADATANSYANLDAQEAAVQDQQKQQERPQALLVAWLDWLKCTRRRKTSITSNGGPFA